MKVVSIFFLFIIFTVNTFAQGRSDDEVMGRVADENTIEKKCFSIKTDILTPPLNYFFYHRPTVCLSLECGFSYRHAFQLTGQYGTFSRPNWQMSYQPVPGTYTWYWKTTLFQTRKELILDYKYYWNDTNEFKGFYCGLYLRGIEYYYKFETMRAVAIDDVKRDYFGFGGGAIVGYQAILKEHFVFDFLFGLGVRNMFLTPTPYDGVHASSNADIPVPLRTEFDIDIRTTINIGYKF